MECVPTILFRKNVYNFTMTTQEKIKKTILIAIGFGISTYLLVSGFAILNQ